MCVYVITFIVVGNGISNLSSILVQAVYISFHANALEKGMKHSVFTVTIEK